jgi:1,5-anhydro-D-fructose reductase (1,5-anhydro-D-mannitol-forming)
LAALLARPEIQCIYISSLPRLHSEHALAALEAGKHVLCESPLALSREAGQLLVRTAAERGLVLAVNHRLRAEPTLVRMRQFVAEGGIGDVLGATIHNINPLATGQHTWRLKPRGGGVIFDRSIHSLDLLRFLFNDEIASVAALGAEQAWGDGVFDDVVINVRMARRQVLVQVRDSYIVPHARDRVELYGTSGTLIARGAFLPGVTGELELVRHGRIQPIPVSEADPFEQVVQAFGNAVRGDGPPLCPGADALVSLEVALAVRASAAGDLPSAP